METIDSLKLYRDAPFDPVARFYRSVLFSAQSDEPTMSKIHN